MGLKDIFKQNLSKEAYYSMSECEDVVIYFPKQQKDYDDNELLGIHLAIDYAIKTLNVDYAKIICFGNNLYGKEINNIWELYPDIKIDVVVCSADTEIINENDRKILKQKIELAKRQEKTSVYEASSPPTLRSCILYRNNTPVLCCVQYYVMSVTENRRPSFTGRGTPCIIACHNGKDFPIKQYIEFCEMEFNRLKSDDWSI